MSPSRKPITASERLHGEAAFVGWLPFGEQGAIVEEETRRLLGDIDVERRAGKDALR